MEVEFPINGIDITFSNNIFRKPTTPILSRPWLEIGEHEFYLNVNNVAHYITHKGEKVSVYPYKDADIDSIQLFLNGSVFGAILHQKSILPFHGCSFEYNGQGIILCGHSGTGKSSVTAAFCQNGGRFINDDITPVMINKFGTTIIPIKSRIKLWDDSLQKLEIRNDDFKKIRPMLDKFYLPSNEDFNNDQSLNHLFILSKHNKDSFEKRELKGMEKYNALRHQIYRKIYLKGMPETEKLYFKQLFHLSGTTRVTQIIRPQICDIYDTMNFIKKEIA